MNIYFIDTDTIQEKQLKTELFRLDRKAQKSTYNCPKRYINEETHCSKTKH